MVFSIKQGALNVSRASPDSNFVFSFGGTKSSEPCVWVVIILLFSKLNI
jgi:hypothetical protein